MRAPPTRSLPAPAAPVARAAAPQGASSSAELGGAYQELCAPGAQQVSAETCAALKADAAPASRRK
jgi:hypothetical protein